MSSERVAASLAPTMGFVDLARSPGAVVSGAIAVLASLPLLGAGLVVWLVILAVVLAAWAGAVWWGSYGVAAASISLTLMTAGFGVASTATTSIVPWTLVGVLGIAQLDAYRLTTLTFRHGRVGTGVAAHVARGTVAIGLTSFVAAIAVDGIGRGASISSWLVVPTALLSVLLLAGVVLLAVARGRAPGDADRWTPGHRLPTHQARLERAPDQPPPPRVQRSAQP